MKNETFFEVLKSEVRKDIQRELAHDLELENQARLDRLTASQRHSATHQHEHLATWLATHLDPLKEKGARSQASPSPAHRVYQSSTRPKSTNSSFTDQSPPKDDSQTQRASNFQEPQTRIQPNDGTKTSEDCAQPVRLSVQSPIEILALRLLNTAGAQLTESLTEQELKQAWKKIALRNHPDRFPTATAAEVKQLNQKFVDLIQANETLKNCTRTK